MQGAEDIKKHLLKQFSLPIEQIEAMMPSFLSTLSSHMDALEDALAGNDLLQLGRAGHTIKGAFLNLGLDECAQIAFEIELSGKSADENMDYRTKIDTLHKHLLPVLK